MSIPLTKNKRWVESLHKSIDQLSEDLKTVMMKQAGSSCAPNILALCEDHLGKRIKSLPDLVTAWNMLRDSRGLNGEWKFENGMVHGIFRECGCPLVRSGLIELHPVQCLCSQGMMETIFSQIAKREVKVAIVRSIGRGDGACEFIVKL